MLKRLPHDDVLELRLDRPPANAFSPELVAALSRAIHDAPLEGARAIVLSGRDGMFSAGLDAPALLELDRDGIRSFWVSFFELMRRLGDSVIPTCAALTGHCPAGGLVIALFCDRRILADGPFKIGLNEVAVGVRIPRPIYSAMRHVVGTRQAERLCATAELLDAQEALRVGLVDELCAPDEVVGRALEWARRMIELPENALYRTRALAREDLLAPFERLDEEQLELFIDDWFSVETQNALRALADRLGGE
jgi:enoyl-CoA hydratase/carnithine racemase